MIDLDKPREGINYTLVPVDESNTQAWDVRLMECDFPETVIRFGNVAFVPEDESLHFNFEVVSSPDSNVDEDTIELQDYAAMVLEDILEMAAADGSLAVKERDDGSSDS